MTRPEHVCGSNWKSFPFFAGTAITAAKGFPLLIGQLPFPPSGGLTRHYCTVLRCLEAREMGIPLGLTPLIVPASLDRASLLQSESAWLEWLIVTKQINTTTNQVRTKYTRISWCAYRKSRASRKAQ